MSAGIMIPVAAGEVIDKITILEIKAQRITDPQRVGNIIAELDALRAVAADAELETSGLREIKAELAALNASIWDAEEMLRRCETLNNFGPEFVAAARRIYLHNDRRFAVKRKINMIMASAIVEEKSY